MYGEDSCKMLVLAIVGIETQGKREVLAIGIGERENQSAWEDLLEDLRRRGVQQIDLWITDGNQAMLNAIANQFPTSQRQRCIQYKMENVLSYLPRKHHEQVRPELRAIFCQEGREKAEQELATFIAKHESVYPSAIAP